MKDIALKFFVEIKKPALQTTYYATISWIRDYNNAIKHFIGGKKANLVYHVKEGSPLNDGQNRWVCGHVRLDDKTDLVVVLDKALSRVTCRAPRTKDELTFIKHSGQEA